MKGASLQWKPHCMPPMCKFLTQWQGMSLFRYWTGDCISKRDNIINMYESKSYQLLLVQQALQGWS